MSVIFGDTRAPEKKEDNQISELVKKLEINGATEAMKTLYETKLKELTEEEHKTIQMRNVIFNMINDEKAKINELAVKEEALKAKEEELKIKEDRLNCEINENIRFIEEEREKFLVMKNDMIEHMKLSAIDNDTQRAVLQEREATLMKMEADLKNVKKEPKKIKKKVALKSSLNAVKTMKRKP